MKKIFVVVCVLAVTLLSSVNPASAERDTGWLDFACKANKQGSDNTVAYVVLDVKLYTKLLGEDLNEPVCANLPSINELHPGNRTFEFEDAGTCSLGPDSLCKQHFTTTELSDWVEKKEMYAYIGDQTDNKYGKWTVNHDGELPKEKFCIGPICITE